MIFCIFLRNRLSFSLSRNSRLVLINAFFQVKLKLPLSELIIALKVIIDFANRLSKTN